MAALTSRLTLNHGLWRNFSLSNIASADQSFICRHRKDFSRKCTWSFKTARSLSQNSNASQVSQALENEPKTHPNGEQSLKRKAAFNCFDELVAHRHAEASRSVVIQVRDIQSADSVWSSCVRFGRIQTLFHYSLSPQRNFFLVEFDTETSVQNLLSSATYPDYTDIIPAQSQFVWIKALNGSASSVKMPLPHNFNLQEDHITKEDDLRHLLVAAETVDDQIRLLHEHTRLTELGQRLRWLVAAQAERALVGLFPHARAFPFGSSVNGCGRDGSDLDVVLSLSHRGVSANESQSYPFVFQTKAALSNGRLQTQRHMETIADILQNFAPGCSQVKRILQARVPIIKYNNEFTGIECDLSMTNMTGVYMSELLFLFGEIDARFRPLVSAVRHWGRSSKLTSSIPGRTITNFTLTLLVVYYMQHRKILPTMNELIRNARPQDRRITEGIDCSFLRDWSSFRGKTTNTESLEDLLVGFLHFVESFDFRQRGISIIWGDTIIKPESSPLYVQNPLERELNVSKNVSLEEVSRLVAEARNALYNLETDRTDRWGLLSFSHGQSDLDKPAVLSSKKLMSVTGFEVKDLFDGSEEEDQPRQVSNPPESDKRIVVEAKPVNHQNSGNKRKGKMSKRKDVAWKYW